MMALSLGFFFFQAEDGIRDPLVTGVQTCALPILVGQAGAGEWGYMAGLSPDGTQIAYTGFAAAVSIRVYVYGIGTGNLRTLIDQSRSEITFVKDGWVWYLEEAPCASGAGGTGPTDKVFAMNLANGVETPVVFAAGESPSVLKSSWGSGQFWP